MTDNHSKLALRDLSNIQHGSSLVGKKGATLDSVSSVGASLSIPWALLKQPTHVCVDV